MSTAPSPQHPFTIPATKTKLTSSEQHTGDTSRKVAFFTLAVISLIACPLAVYGWYMWAATASVCIDTYIAPTTQDVRATSESNETSAELAGGTEGTRSASASPAVSWQQKFFKLDISSFSALILALFFTRLAYAGCRNVWQWARVDGQAYFDHAYHNILFTEGFDTLSIRLGLLGTLLSFLLAALLQLAPAENPTAQAQAAAQSDLTGVMADEGASGLAEATVDSATADPSGKMFLLLCASLVSTFVGTGMAYVITPSLNWLNDRAVGQHQIAVSDIENVSEEFFRQITRTSERLAQFETTTVKLTEAADHISSFEVNVGRASQNLASLLAVFESAIQTWEISNQNGQELIKKLESMELQNGQLQRILASFPDKMTQPLESISRTSARFKEAAQSGETAFRELKSAASSAHDSLKETTQRSKVSWKMLHEVRDSLAELAKSDRLQADQAAQLTQTMEQIGASTGTLIEGLNSLSYQLHSYQTGDGKIVGSVAAYSTPAETQVERPSRSVPRRRSPPATAPLRPSQPWWRRWF